MKWLRIVIILAILAILVVYGVVVSAPTERYKPLIDEQLTLLAERHKDALSRLRDPQKNGFLNPQLAPFWTTSKNEGPTKDTLTGWVKNFSVQGSGKAVDHTGLLKNPGYLDLRKAVVALLPAMVEAFTKPYFHPVNDDPARPANIFNEKALTTIALALNGYAESLVAEGQPGKAALAYQLVFVLGQRVGIDSGTVQSLYGLSLQGLAFQSLVANLRPDARLTPEQWAELSRTLASAAPSPDWLLLALQHDLAMGDAFLSQPRSAYDGDVKFLRGVYLLPGMRARDLRIYHNLMGEVISELRQTGRIAPRKRPEGWRAYAAGDVGSGTNNLFPPDSYSKQSARLGLHSAKMAGLAATAAVCAYREKFGKLPASLADLDRLDLKTPAGLPYSQARGVVYEPKGDRALIGVAVKPETFVAAEFNAAKAAEIERRNSLYFSIQDSGFLFEI